MNGEPLVFLAEPPKTAYDLYFHIGPVPVRISPFFWVLAALLGWSSAVSIDKMLGDDSLGAGVWLLLWVAAVLISILVHEIGHWLAMRWYGTDAYVVLYHFGGLAVPRGNSSFGGYGGDYSRGNQIVISAAGPAAQLLLACGLVVGTLAAGYRVYDVPFFNSLIPDTGRPFPSFALAVFVDFLIVSSVYWALLNLLPVYPLDGGHIAREVFLRIDAQSGIRNSLILSIAASGVVAFYAFVRLDDKFFGIMMVALAYSSFQTLQRYTGGGFGGRGW